MPPFQGPELRMPYQPVPPPELKAVLEAEQLKGLTQTAILSHWLHQWNIPFADSVTTNACGQSLRNAIIIGLDAEWYEHDASYITELGVSILDPNFINIQAADSPWIIAKGLVNHHVRIKENAHMVNSELCTGFPDKFQFGETSYVSVQEAKDMLLSAFVKTDHRGRLRPVIFIGHAISNDYEVIKERFGLDIASLGVVVATLDTQVLASGKQLAPAGRAIRLKDLLGHFEIQEPYLHNAGNDIVSTMVAALVIASPQPVTPTHPASAYADLKTYLKNTSKCIYGQPRFCTRCSSSMHTLKYCNVRVYCAHCGEEPAPLQPAGTHSQEKCLELVKERVLRERGELRSRGGSPVVLNPTPCELCIVSEDPDRYRIGFAYGHATEECGWRGGM
jgi:hypothetical protein